jgi:hypothetical protein
MNITADDLKAWILRKNPGFFFAPAFFKNFDDFYCLGLLFDNPDVILFYSLIKG